MASPFMIAGAVFNAYGQIRAGQAESRRQAAIAAQQEQNKKFEKLKALQDHNARLDSFFVKYLSLSSSWFFLMCVAGLVSTKSDEIALL